MIAELFIVFIARYVSILLPLILTKIFLGKKIPLNFRELQFLFLAGLVRGTIAFALVLKLNVDMPSRGVIITTTLMIVVVTTLVFGSAMPFMS